MGVGKVYLVGAGPGDPGLLTLRGAEVLARADVVVYDGLANAALLEHAPAGAERVYAGKKRSEHGSPLSQEEIDALLVERARRGLTVVRLKGGDPFVFGRGGEEVEVLVAAGIPFEIVPGVSAVFAVPAYAGIPLTHRDAASSVVFIATGQEEADRGRVDWAAAARADTLVLFMAVKTLPDIVASLLGAGRAADTPVAVIRWGTTAAQRTVVAPLGEIPGAVARAHLEPPALVVIGDVVRYRERLAWFERRPLFGASVLVPRARAAAAPFVRALTELGAETVVAEVTRVEPIADAAIDLDGFRWVAFASAHAVATTVGALGRRGPTRAPSPACASPPSATPPPRPRRARPPRRFRRRRRPGAELAHALARRGPGSPGARVLLPRAAEGREELADALAAAGVAVVAVAAYRTVAGGAPAELAPLARAPRRRRLLAPSQVEALVAAAGADALGRARIVAAIGATTPTRSRAPASRRRRRARAPMPSALAAALASTLVPEAR